MVEEHKPAPPLNRLPSHTLSSDGSGGGRGGGGGGRRAAGAVWVNNLRPLLWRRMCATLAETLWKQHPNTKEKSVKMERVSRGREGGREGGGYLLCIFWYFH